MFTLAAASFIAIFFFDVPFPLLVVSAGLIGFIGGKVSPQRFCVIKGHGTQSASADQANVHTGPRPTLSRSLIISGICLTLWFGPIVGFWFTLGPDSVFFQEGMFFSKAAVVTFGGAYSVLAYIAQQAVEKYAWLRPGEMLDGLGMAETTPGPLIMVVQFVGFMGAYRNPGPFSPIVAGIIGSMLTTWVTFVPCFFWIFLGAPYIERLRGNKLLSAALSAITAAVVGVVLNLAVWFSLHTLFARVESWEGYGVRLLVPDWSTIDYAACGIAMMAGVLTFYWKKGMAFTLAASALVGMGLYFSWRAA
jgi:chromate transporter